MIFISSVLIANRADLLPGVLVRRYRRFITDVRLGDGTVVTAHTPNTGSMMQCAVPGHAVLVSRSHNPVRKLPFTLELIRVKGRWVDTHTHRANRVVEEALRGGKIEGLEGWSVIPEQRFNKSRFDFRLENHGRLAFLEVKNSTLICGPHTACFPDAVTTRGQKHLADLENAVKAGHRAMVLFLVQRSEARAFTPADHIDPEYGRLLRRAVKNGVEALACKTRIRPPYISLGRRIPVVLD